MSSLAKERDEDLMKARDSLFAFMDDMRIRDSVNLEDLDGDSDSTDTDDEAVKRSVYKSPTLIKAMNEKKLERHRFQRTSVTEQNEEHGSDRVSADEKAKHAKTPATKVKLAGSRGRVLSPKSLDAIPKMIKERERKVKKKKSSGGWFACCAGDRDSDDDVGQGT